jgi:hypothetical protein
VIVRLYVRLYQRSNKMRPRSIQDSCVCCVCMGLIEPVGGFLERELTARLCNRAQSPPKVDTPIIILPSAEDASAFVLMMEDPNTQAHILPGLCSVDRDRWIDRIVV